MDWSLLNSRGQRKYLTSTERAAFIEAAVAADPITGTFCLTLALTGARISEVLALTPESIDAGTGTIIFETLKRREKGIFRAVPVPINLIKKLTRVHGIRHDPSCAAPAQRIWQFSRPTAWKRVKRVMRLANIPPSVAKPRALRHAFGVEAVRQRIALSVLKRWLGHAKIETTAIYAQPIGEEERALARLMWRHLPPSLNYREDAP